MDRQEIAEALEEVGAELEREGLSARLYAVGGAVMVLDVAARESTDDVDCAVYPAEEVLDIAAAVGARRGLRGGWLNDAAKVCIPVFKRPDWRPVRKVGSLEIFTADARAMLAMKMRASRGRRDEGDLAILLDACGITTEDDALSLYDEYFPEDRLPDRAGPMIRFALQRRDS